MVEKILEESSTPSLDILRALVNEGKRILYELESPPHLNAFVDLCLEWVDKAANLIIEKQQNSHKNEEAGRKGLNAKERDQELQGIGSIKNLLADAKWIGIDCPEIPRLCELTTIGQKTSGRRKWTSGHMTGISIMKFLLTEAISIITRLRGRRRGS